jgi:hypothetical protein
MIKEFEKLREDEVEVLLNAPINVTILIAGADGNIDGAEQKHAVEIAKAKQSRANEQLLDYYNEVGARFEAKFHSLIETYPKAVEERNKLITLELRKLNFIFAKIDKSYSTKIYGSLKELAKRIAESSGGLLGYGSVSYDEAKLMELKMLNDPSK